MTAKQRQIMLKLLKETQKNTDLAKELEIDIKMVRVIKNTDGNCGHEFVEVNE